MERLKRGCSEGILIVVFTPSPMYAFFALDWFKINSPLKSFPTGLFLSLMFYGSRPAAQATYCNTYILFGNSEGRACPGWS